MECRHPFWIVAFCVFLMAGFFCLVSLPTAATAHALEGHSSHSISADSGSATGTKHCDPGKSAHCCTTVAQAIPPADTVRIHSPLYIRKISWPEEWRRDGISPSPLVAPPRRRT
jgi:hypothetical protein